MQRESPRGHFTENVRESVCPNASSKQSQEQKVADGECMGDVPKLIEINGPAPICIEHPNHHTHRMRIKGTPISIHKRTPQLSLTQLSAAIFVHGPEQLPQRFPIVCVLGWHGCRWGSACGASRTISTCWWRGWTSI
jgi:hypothetical protein